MDLRNKIDLEEERKDMPSTSVPHEIYNSDYQMVNFPAQSFQSIKDFEQKINTICEYFEVFQKVYSPVHIFLTNLKTVHIFELKML